MCFASSISGGFTTMAVINPPERKLAKRTSVHCAPRRRAPRRWSLLDRWIYGTQAAAMYYSRATACHSGFKRLKPAKNKLTQHDFTSFPIQISANSVSGHCVPYIIPKFVKSLQALLWSINFTIFFGIWFLEGFCFLAQLCGSASLVSCCDFRRLELEAAAEA